MIKLENVTKIYPPDVKALYKVNLHIKPGEFVSIVGQSGTGKTTLVKILIGEEKPSQGKIVVGGWDITNIGPAEIPVLRRQIGVVFQDFKLLHRKTLFENVCFALQVCGEPQSKINNIVPQVLKIVGLENKMHRYPLEVSGGEQQRAVIARALVHRPKILLADEPTGNLDSINADEIIEILQKINKFGTTVLLVTHNRDVVNKLRKRVITIENGLIVGDQAVGKYIL
ncbi:MAG: Cell division ATP-binding protein FtsE [Parcubacteria group bacterium GW2011_GWC2_42_12]|uniref:Cell division ATP-binding protein FtsE n=1 Tax=Candidatus Falkowbacteria bacterium GW2011_GWA2_41_14 TaxID=1618635 RepID=A0A0G0USG5_9BACT|nr:MAG: Cell division ATP-binding protein FtsE [Candidatus Falkowbacteria bacterium GW2011_GWA2_41_14]KKS32128.1 MAG: Cell division ATP-binding protein FtsE [Parcubacteria group bacterium GW2011_GWC2_42_12]